MHPQPPDPPAGVANVHSQPGREHDGGLAELRDSLTSELTDDVLQRLTHYLPEEDIPEHPGDEYRTAALEYLSECLTYRENIRPESLRDHTALPEGITRVTDGSWVVYHSEHELSHDRTASDADTHEAGKYLFFAPENVRQLETILLEQLQQRPYSGAKIPTIPGKKQDWVLCLYQDDNRYWYDLREEYHDPPTVRFRGYKTNAATEQGEYSDQFMDSR